MVQTTYNLYLDESVEGLVADIRTSVVESRAAEGNIGFGRALVPGSDAEKQAKLPSAASQEFLGISRLTQSVEQATADITVGNIQAGDGYYRDTRAVNVLRRGVIWVYTLTNVTVGDPVYFVHTGTDAELGYFRNDADGGDADLVPTGLFKASKLAGELVPVEINLP